MSLATLERHGLCVVEDSLILAADAFLGSLFGRDADDLQGRHILDLCVPEERGALRKAVRDCRTEPLNFTGMGASGEAVPVQVSTRPSVFQSRERQVLVFKRLRS